MCVLSEVKGMVLNMDKVVNLLKDKDITIPKLLLRNYKKLNINESELIILIFLINSTEYNPKSISDYMDIKFPVLLEMISELESKGMLKIELKNINGINTEVCNLDTLYEKLSLLVIKKEDTKDNNSIYDVFETELGRTLSPIEYELVSDWLNDNTEEILKLALKEATYNGVSNFRYIDRIIHEWRKKGIKTKDDVIKNNEEFRKNKSDKKQELFDYDWLNG